MAESQSARPERIIREFVDDVHDEFEHIHAVDYSRRDGDKFVCMEWHPSPAGKEEITGLQLRVTGVDKQFDHIGVDYANVARGYVKFDAVDT